MRHTVPPALALKRVILFLLVLSLGCTPASETYDSGRGFRLIAGEWQLESIEGSSIEDRLGRVTPRPALTFHRHGRVTIIGGVSRFTAWVDDHGLDDDRMTVMHIAKTGWVFPPSATVPGELVEVEKQFTEALAKVTNYRLEDRDLVLISRGNEVLRFSEPD